MARNEDCLAVSSGGLEELNRLKQNMMFVCLVIRAIRNVNCYCECYGWMFDAKMREV